MTDMLREAPLGQVIRWITGNRLLKYPEELPDFELPATYNAILNAPEHHMKIPTAQRTKSRESRLRTSRSSSDEDSTPPTEDAEIEKTETDRQEPTSMHKPSQASSDEGTTPGTLELEKRDLEKMETQDANPIEHKTLSLNRTKSRLETMPYTEERLELEAELALERTKTAPITPAKTADGNILVDFYTTDDPANPQNWSNTKRFFISFIICLYTFVVYTGSAIYTTSELGVIQKFGVTPLDASLPLSLYVLAYGMGPLIWAPLSEIPIIGRSPVYASTMAIFVILSLPTALVDNFAGLLVLRFLQGFFGSPCLANGAATMQDMYSLLYLPYALVAWVSAAYCGPALGPLLSGFAVMAKGWRWSLWEILWVSSPYFLTQREVVDTNAAVNRLQDQYSSSCSSSYLKLPPPTSSSAVHNASASSPAINASCRSPRSTRST